MSTEKYPFPFYFYIITNKNKTVLYCGMTNNLSSRVKEHENAEGNYKRFTGRYNCHYLIYYEGSHFVQDAIRREKEVKKCSRIKKERLIDTLNPDRRFLNVDSTFGNKGKVIDHLSSE
jgi:putative endonuclease